MSSKESNQDFEVLGTKISVRPTETKNGASAEDVVAYISERANNIKDSNPSLGKSETAILLALELAHQKLSLEKEYKEQISKFESAAKDAYQFIDQLTPKNQ